MTANRRRKQAVRNHKATISGSYSVARRALFPAQPLGPISAALLSRYTGLRTHAVHQSSADQPSPERAQFDAAVMEQICRAGGFYWAHPLGVCAVEAAVDRTVIDLDSHTVTKPDGPADQHPSMADFLLRRLVPSYDADADEINGIPGLRLATDPDGAPHELLLADLRGPGRVVLRAVHDTDWSHLISDYDHDLRADGLVPLWFEEELAPQEADDLTRDFAEPFREHQRRLAPLGAALLYRINLFYAASTAYTTSSWVTGDRWIVEMRAVDSGGTPHADFLAALLDPVWGLPIRPVLTECSCSSQHRTRQCTYIYRHPGTRGRLELRFQYVEEQPHGVRAGYERVGASADWLDRVLPSR